MTDKLYYTSPYLKELDAIVTGVEGDGFILDRTIFYPECGGQRGDSGTWNGKRIVTTLHSSTGEPLHITEGELPSLGESVHITLDWNERYFGMKEHTAQHLISSVLYGSFGIGTVAVHHGEEEITVETDRAVIDEETLLSVEEKALALIGENRRVWMEDRTREEVEKMNLRRSIKVEGDDVKVVFISDQDAVPCGGVHVSSLGEIGELVYTGSETIRGHVRTLWKIAGKAREVRRENQDIVSRGKILLSSDSSSFIGTLERVLEENRELKKTLREMRMRDAEREFSEKKGKNVVYRTECELDALIKTATKDSSRRVFIIGPGKTFLFVGTKDEFSRLRDKLSLRGGGREPLFRGTFAIGEDEVLPSAESFLGSL